SWPVIGTAPVPISAPLPALTNVVWNTPTAPAPFTTSLSISNIIPSPFQGVAPTLSFGNAPAAFSTVAPVAPAINTSFSYPTVTTPTLPNAPTLLSISQVSFNPLAIPSFGVNVPALTLSPP